MAKCSACGAEIMWCVTRKARKLQPLDAEPRDDGNVRLVDEYVATKRGAAQVCEPVGDEQLFPYDGPRYMPHHATCPHADRFKNRPKET